MVARNRTGAPASHISPTAEDVRDIAKEATYQAQCLAVASLQLLAQGGSDSPVAVQSILVRMSDLLDLIFGCLFDVDPPTADEVRDMTLRLTGVPAPVEVCHA